MKSDFVGVKLIFFSIGSVSLCFEFVLETALKIQGCFNMVELFFHRVKIFFCFSHHLTSKETGGAQGVRKAHSHNS